jgi:catechol 2,3-dioxygenase-like lactoylglutathione lyase family enzyme
MPKIQHIAIVSPKRDALVEFYKKAFGMKQVEGEGSAVYLSDGAVNLALIQQYPGRDAGLYHFGFEVQDIEALKKALKEAGFESEIQKRPRNREAEYRVLDPDGNAIDLSTHGWPV